MAPSTAAPHDPGGATAHVSRFSSELPSLWRGSRGLLPPLLPMLVGSGGMAGDGGGPTLRDLWGGVLELLVGRLLQTGGGLEADLRHSVGDLDPQERGNLQGHLPVRWCHYTYSWGILFFLAPRWQWPLELCIPAVTDLVAVLFSLAQWNLGAPLGVLPSLNSKKNEEPPLTKETGRHRDIYVLLNPWPLHLSPILV